MPLHLFADTRYRLRVNGDFVATGPGRFVTQFPEYDSHELSRHLRAGTNVISVEVNFFGASSYQSMPDGEPGFIAAGGNELVDLSTPGDWRAYRLNAWRWDAPVFSFAQNPVEICDTRLLSQGTPVALRECTGESAPWGPLRPYSGLPIPFIPTRPTCLELAGALADHERRCGFMVYDPGAERGLSDPAYAKPWTAFATWIHSPSAQRTVLSAFWSDLLLNGQCVPVVISNGALGNHGQATLDLQAGWNLLTGEVQAVREFWAYCLGIPHTANLTLHARQDIQVAEPFSLAPLGPREALVIPKPGDLVPPSDWYTHKGDISLLTPARIMAWDRAALDAHKKLDPARLPEFASIDAAAATWCFSFAGEFLGHVVLSVNAPAGSMLDVAYDDWPREEGGVALYRAHPFTDTADRFILRGGPQQVESFHPRGGKLIQVTLRVPAGQSPARLSLHDLWVRSRQTLGRDESNFSSDHPELTWAWPVAMRTLRVSADESYTDCPWRERGTYIGDSLVSLHLNALLSPNLTTGARVLRQFAEAQLPDGQLACCAPAWLRKPHEDFTLLWIIALHDYWQFTGDADFLREHWPTVQRIWDSPSWASHASGLWHGINRRFFLDWGIRSEEREGEANAAINLLRVAAGRASATMAGVLGENVEAARHANDAESSQRAIFAHLWDGTQNRLRASLGSSTSALHANVLALCYEIGSKQERSSILAYLEPHLEKNLEHGLQHGQHGGHLELFYLYFVLPGLAKHGRPDLAERMIAQHYGYLMKLGDDTLPECFSTVGRSSGSRCHSWSGAAAIYAARYVLGLRPAGDGNHRHLIFNPVVHGIRQASGLIAHADGWIEVSWKMENGVRQHHLNAPASVRVSLG